MPNQCSQHRCHQLNVAGLESGIKYQRNMRTTSHGVLVVKQSCKLSSGITCASCRLHNPSHHWSFFHSLATPCRAAQIVKCMNIALGAAHEFSQQSNHQHIVNCEHLQQEQLLVTTIKKINRQTITIPTSLTFLWKYTCLEHVNRPVHHVTRLQGSNLSQHLQNGIQPDNHQPKDL